MPQLDPTFYTAQLFWLLVTFATLFLVMWRFALPRVGEILANRQNRMESDLGRAATLKKEADEVMAAYEAELATSRTKAHEAVRAMQEKATALAAARNAEIEAKLIAELAEADTRIAAERDVALANISTIAADIAAAAFEKLIGEAADEGAVAAAVEKAQGEHA